VDAYVAAEIEAAVAAARAAPDPAPETLTTDVYVTYGAA
jgi:TPP-dependent pyruvate/acetoin dehydrogenase alpha subunit